MMIINKFLLIKLYEKKDIEINKRFIKEEKHFIRRLFIKIFRVQK